MKIMRSSGLVGSLVLVGVLLFGGGCGYKNRPVPPQNILPKAIEDLRYSVEGDGVTLTWSYPVETVTGKDLSDVLSFELFKAEVPLADFCSGCPIPFDDPVELLGGASGGETRRKAEHKSGMMRSGHKYFFKVRSRTSWWVSSNDSNIVTFVYNTPAAAPTDLQATAAEDRVTLGWAKVTTYLNGKPADLPLSYQVMRSTDGETFTAVGAPVTATEYVDTNVEEGKQYHYKVESSMLLEEMLVRGSLSQSVSAAVADLTPPAVVTGVTVVASTQNNRLFWDGVKDNDLAGYKVYRRVDGQKNATLLGSVGATKTIFIDNDVLDTRVYYSVTSIDNARPANESARSTEATTRH